MTRRAFTAVMLGGVAAALGWRPRPLPPEIWFDSSMSIPGVVHWVSRDPTIRPRLIMHPWMWLNSPCIADVLEMSASDRGRVTYVAYCTELHLMRPGRLVRA